jgi:hypothetical protein
MDNPRCPESGKTIPDGYPQRMEINVADPCSDGKETRNIVKKTRR